MEIRGAYDGSEADRALAITSNIRINKERIEDLDKAFGESISKHGAIKVWRFVLIVSIPVILATWGLHAHPEVGMTAAAWREMLLRALIVWLVSGAIVNTHFGKDIVGDKLVSKAKDLLHTHNEIIDIVYRLEDISRIVDSLDANRIETAVVVRPEDDFCMRAAVVRFDAWCVQTSERLYVYRLTSEDSAEARLVEDSLDSSREYLIQLLRSRLWLNKYIQLIR
ncbi:MAG: hypothetical protein K2Y22_06165 [Candidatus Obscuribacterales bacterium]|nr:hypothetical protein [Candidatus Obscuribacterales bacterium]